ncbi:hypothetical protein SAMN05216238_10213 [Lentibacillus persicus]|uniref:Uncharacterized protein n=1 Tax=Lentibacillus persicus TaxID=640948 RepID=A0A1I1SX43_9BACI|nr:hypothetical protein [Lentibacillus persicus]SFD50911.1 hypothetical protein SAMN05216238_10213 [Lentibacillus persicus]
MENKTKEADDQASELRKLLDEVENGQEVTNLEETTHQRKEAEADTEKKSNRDLNIDILNLPPRKEVHGSTKTHTRLKMSNPSKRFITVAVLLVVLFVVMFYFWGEELLDVVENM